MSTKNNVSLIGNVGSTPELKKTKEGTPYINVSIAVNKRYKDDDGETKTITNWFPFTIWAKRAEALSKIIKKGQTVAVSGELTTKVRKVGSEEITVIELKIDDLEIIANKKSADEEEVE